MIGIIKNPMGEVFKTRKQMIVKIKATSDMIVAILDCFFVLSISSSRLCMLRNLEPQFEHIQKLL